MYAAARRLHAQAVWTPAADMDMRRGRAQVVVITKVFASWEKLLDKMEKQVDALLKIRDAPVRAAT
jgi:hypothetical protein